MGGWENISRGTVAGGNMARASGGNSREVCRYGGGKDPGGGTKVWRGRNCEETAPGGKRAGLKAG